MSDLNKLSVELLHREKFSDGTLTKTERVSSDFLVDGRSLRQLITTTFGGHDDYMGCFCKGWDNLNEVSLDWLLTRRPPETEEGRYLLYRCPECGDIECGSFGCRINVQGDRITWSDFAYENGYEPSIAIPKIGPFVFQKFDYFDLMERSFKKLSDASI